MSVANKLLQAAAGNAGGDPVYVDDVFSTYLYEGTGLPRTIANGINLGSGNVTAFGYGDDSTSVTVTLNYLAEGDVVVVFNTGSSTGATVTVGGSSATVLEQDYTSPTYSYEHSTFAYTVASGDPATMDVVITNNTFGGLVLVIKGGATVTLQAGGSANSTNTITEPDFSTTGYGLILTSDRDPGATSLTTTDADLTNLIIDDSPSFFVHSCWEMDSGNGGTISGFNDGSNFEQVHVVLKVEGAGTTAFGNTEADGGLVWTKARENTSGGGTAHALIDTVRGSNKWIYSDGTGAEATNANLITAFNSNGYSVGTGGPYWTNDDGYEYVSWTFRKQKKFFDVVTWTGNSTSGRTVSHNLGSVPGMIMVKRRDASGAWQVYHRANTANPETDYLVLDTTAATNDSVSRWNDTAPTSTEFTLGNSATVNYSGGTYVAYLFAHDEQDFGEDSDEAIIKCGGYTGNNSATGPTIDLGFEPQWVMIKNVDAIGNWNIYDSMRGIVTGGNEPFLHANNSNADNSTTDRIQLTSTGFQVLTTSANVNSANDFIYMAIARPHKPAEEFAATDLFAIDTKGGTSPTPPAYVSGFPVDMSLHKNVSSTGDWRAQTRLTQGTYLETNNTDFQVTDANMAAFDFQNGYRNATGTTSSSYAWMWRRAKGYFDVVAYTGDGNNPRTLNHNLGVAPEMIIVKARTDPGFTGNWTVWHTFTSTGCQRNFLNTTAAKYDVVFSDTGQPIRSQPTATALTLGSNAGSNKNAIDYIAYLFASVDGISKVGTYTGSGSTQTIDCGFSNGARFVLIKCTSGSSNWFLWDSERGITSGLDNYILVNSTAAQTTNSPVDVNPASSGFEVFGNDSDSNRNGETYLFYAIA
jgi:hypothetical protein